MWSEETILMKTTLKDEKTPATCRERKRVLGARRRLHQDPEAGQRCLFLKMTRRFGRCSKGTCTSIINSSGSYNRSNQAGLHSSHYPTYLCPAVLSC